MADIRKYVLAKPNCEGQYVLENHVLIVQKSYFIYLLGYKLFYPPFRYNFLNTQESFEQIFSFIFVKYVYERMYVFNHTITYIIINVLKELYVYTVDIYQCLFRSYYFRNLMESTRNIDSYFLVINKVIFYPALTFN